MNRTAAVILAAIGLAPFVHAQPATARMIEQTWKNANDRWLLDWNAASSEQRATLIDKRPNPANYTDQMWQAISPSLANSWTLPHTAWLLPAFAQNPARAREFQLMLDSVGQTHLRSPQLTPVCIALGEVNNPKALPLLESIAAKNPDPKVQGVAALAASLRLKALGDTPELTRKRLSHLRNAIIKSSDVELSPGSTVAAVAGDELYVIRYLTKGRTAPALEGSDSGGRPMSLSDHVGKVIVLLFWKSDMPDADKTVALTAESAAKYRGKPIDVVGVNMDPTATLRKLQADGTVTWPTFSDPAGELGKAYRATTHPTVFVLDQKGAIQYSGSPGSFAELTATGLLTPADSSETKTPASR